MAANLTKPEHFEHPRKKNEFPALIPPSAFEGPPVIPPQRAELEKAVNEIELLKIENRRLKSNHSQQHAQFPSPVIQSDYADELIKRQSCEIAELKSELMKRQQLHEQDFVEWEKEMKALQQSQEYELKQARGKEESFEKTIEKLSTDLQSLFEENSFSKEILESTKKDCCIQIKQKEEELLFVRKQTDTQLRELEIENRQKSVLLEESLATNAQLKHYIGQTEEKNKPAMVWKIEKETLENQVKIKQAEHDKLQSHMQLLEVRFKALKDIISIQEGELEKKKDSKQKHHDLLLTKWREKVFALLVQQKSAEIVHNNDLNKAKLEILELTDKIQSYAAEQEVLKNSLTDKKAELEMETQQKRDLMVELAQVQEAAGCLDDESQNQMHAVQSMAQSAHSVEEKYNKTFKVLEEKVSAINALGQRVSFAARRMEYLKTQMLRKAALSTVPTELGNESKKSISRSMSRSRSRVDDDMSRDSEEHLYQELERVMRERDSLATQVRTDSVQWSQKITETRTIYQTEVHTLKKTVEDLEYDIQRKSKLCNELTEQLSTLGEETKEYQDTIAQLQAELARHARGVEGVLTDQHMKDEEIYAEKLADISRQLNDSKREHAKTIVVLRQLERTRTRESEMSKSLFGSSEQHSNYQVQQLQAQLMNLEKERNTMAATLRQEGLLSRLKSSRGEPVWLPLEEEEGEERDKDKERVLFPTTTTTTNASSMNTNTNTKEMSGKEEDGEDKYDEESHVFEPNLISGRRPSGEGVESVLQDLKSLSAAIFSGNLSPDNSADEDG